MRCRFPLVAAPPKQRNPLLIPGVIFGVVAFLLVGAVIVYAAVGGDDSGGETPVAQTPATVTTSASAAAPRTTAAPATSGPPSPSATASSAPAAPNCIVGVWIEEKHDEDVTVLNTGVFRFTGSGAFQRYTSTGRVTFDYGDGMRLTGSGNGNTYEYVFAGLISYTYKVENGQVVYANPRADGTETFRRNGVVDFSGKLEARLPAPKKVTCGNVAMNLSNAAGSIDLRRTSSAG